MENIFSFFLIFTYILIPNNMIILFFVYLISMSQIVLYFLHSTSVLPFYIDVVLTLSIMVANDKIADVTLSVAEWTKRCSSRMKIEIITHHLSMTFYGDGRWLLSCKSIRSWWNVWLDFINDIARKAEFVLIRMHIKGGNNWNPNESSEHLVLLV